jgi:hypothetical protein
MLRFRSLALACAVVVSAASAADAQAQVPIGTVSVPITLANVDSITVPAMSVRCLVSDASGSVEAAGVTDIPYTKTTATVSARSTYSYQGTVTVTLYPVGSYAAQQGAASEAQQQQAGQGLLNYIKKFGGMFRCTLLPVSASVAAVQSSAGLQGSAFPAAVMTTATAKTLDTGAIKI